MKDFFISYTSVDQKWAEWIAHTLEAANFTTIIQAWDFRPGHNFALEMKEATAAAKRTIVVLSPAYLESRYASSEWASAFARDPDGKGRRLIPVRVQSCEVEGLQRPIIYIDLIDLDAESARDALLSGVREGRAKPTQTPRFPGKGASEPTDPVHSSVQPTTKRATTPAYMPKIRRAPTDADKRRFVRQAFEQIQRHFEQALRELDEANEDIESDFQLINATEFRAEIFLNGRSVSCSRFWQGTIFGGDGISVSDGNNKSHNSCNESLSVEIGKDGELCLRADMGRFTDGGHHSRMNQIEAADYLWRRFVKALEFER